MEGVREAASKNIRAKQKKGVLVVVIFLLDEKMEIGSRAASWKKVQWGQELDPADPMDVPCSTEFRHVHQRKLSASGCYFWFLLLSRSTAKNGVWQCISYFRLIKIR